MSEENKKELEELSEASQNSSDVQKAMIEKAEAHSQDTMAMASDAFDGLAPRALSYLPQLSKKQLIRLLAALYTYPLNPNDFNHRGLEKEAFMVGNRLLEAKYVMIMHTHLEEVHKINQMLEEKERNGKEEENDNEEKKDV